MAAPLVPDALWERVEPLPPLPKPRRFRYPGRKPLTNRQALTGILFVLKTGSRWNDLPRELGGGSGSRCRRRLQAWHRAGIWHRLHALLLAELQGADKIDWSRAAVASSFVRARGGGAKTGPSPGDRRNKGSKHHAVVDGHGIPLATTVSAANAPDVTALEEVGDAIPEVHGKPGRPRRRPDELLGDGAYDRDPHRDQMQQRGMKPKFGRRKRKPGRGLGKVRWVVERFFSWLHRYGRLRLRTDQSAQMQDAFLKLASVLICLSFL